MVQPPDAALVLAMTFPAQPPPPPMDLPLWLSLAWLDVASLGSVASANHGLLKSVRRFKQSKRFAPALVQNAAVHVAKLLIRKHAKCTNDLRGMSRVVFHPLSGAVPRPSFSSPAGPNGGKIWFAIAGPSR